MHRQFEKFFRNRKLNHSVLHKNIISLFPHVIPTHQYNYDEILFILDQQHQKCDRQVVKQLFNQSCNAQNTTSLQALVTRYIQNIEASKMCLLRQEHKLSILQQKIQKLKERQHCFVFMKVIQVSMFSRMTQKPIFQYQISPSNIPSVTLSDSMNPVLNHEFMLQMQQDQFDLIFKQSGITVFTWTFPETPGLGQGEYHRVVRSENVNFEAMIKYMPRLPTKQRDSLQKQKQIIQQKMQNQAIAFHKLCNFEPFLIRNHKIKQSQDQRGGLYKFTEILFFCLPFLRDHVRWIFCLLMLDLWLQCWISSFESIQFLDIIVIFYAMGVLMNPKIKDCTPHLLFLFFKFLLLTIKSIWGAVIRPYFDQKSSNHVLLIAALIVKLSIFLAIGISLIRSDQINPLKQKIFFKNDEGQRNSTHRSIYFSDEIWQRINT